jgi:hypothetical protein
VSVTEFERHQLFSWFEEHMGRERAATMMSLVPPAGWGDVVTRRDLHVVEARVDLLDSSLNARIDALDRTLNARIDVLEARLDAKLEARLGEFRSEMMRTLGTWLFASQAVVIAAVSVLITLD